VRCSHREYSYYYCSSEFPGHGPKCGLRAVRQDAADQTVERIMSNEFLDAAFLRAVLGRFESSQPARDQNTEKITGQGLLRMTLKGLCTEEDFARESKHIEAELRDLDRLMPAPVPAVVDTAKLVVHVTCAFARFHNQPMQERRDLLRTVFNEIVLDHRAITGMTLNGGFLDFAARRKST
jgi:hypothetical protein